MKINEIEKNEWKEVLDLYFEEKGRYGDSVTIEDVVESMRRCEICGKLELTDDELPTITTWRGETLHCCTECYEEEKDEDCHYNDDDEYEVTLKGSIWV